MGSLFSNIKGSVDDSINMAMFQPPPLNRKDYNTILQENMLMIDGLVSCIQIRNRVSSRWMILSHGNGATIIEYYPLMLEWSKKLNINILIFDYPGYGMSVGISTEDGCCDYHSRVVDYLLKSGVDKRDIILCGQSLGTGVVVDYISNSNHDWITPVILISPYTSIIDAGTDMMSSTTSFNSVLRFVDKFYSINKIQNAKCKVNIYHGNFDTIIPYSHSERLAKKCDSNLKILSQVGHNNVLQKIPIDMLYSNIWY